MIRYLFLLLVLMNQVHAQKPGVKNQPVLFNISIAVDHISLPGNAKYKPRHRDYPRKALQVGWSLSGGADFRYTENGNHESQWYQSFRLGYLSNPGIQHALSITTEPVFLLKASYAGSAFIQSGLQLGYMRVYPTGGMIRRNKESFLISHTGRGQVIGGLMLGSGYGRVTESAQWQMALQYRLWLQGPFIPGIAPALPHQSVTLSNSFTR
jgi:hypothetical protein